MKPKVESIVTHINLQKMLSLNKISANAALFMLASAMQVAADCVGADCDGNSGDDHDAQQPGDSVTDLYDDYDCKASNGCGSSSDDEWYFVVFALLFRC